MDYAETGIMPQINQLSNKGKNTNDSPTFEQPLSLLRSCHDKIIHFLLPFINLARHCIKTARHRNWKRLPIKFAIILMLPGRNIIMMRKNTCFLLLLPCVLNVLRPCPWS